MLNADGWSDLIAPGWTAQAVVGMFGIVATLIVAGLTWLQGALTRSHATKLAEKQAQREKDFYGREQWWERFTWVLGEYYSPEELRRVVAVRLFEELEESSWASDEDRKLILAVLSETSKEARREAT